MEVEERSSASVYHTECKPKNKNWGRPGNEADSRKFSLVQNFMEVRPDSSEKIFKVFIFME